MFNQFKIESNQSVDVLEKRFQSRTIAKDYALTKLNRKISSGFSQEHLFVGSVQGNEFSVQRDSLHRNFCLPSISGKIEPAPGGSVVSGKIHMQPFGLLLILLAECAWGYQAVKAFLDPNGGERLRVFLMFLIVGTLVILAYFFSEVVKAKGLLNTVITDEGAASQIGS